LTAEGVTIRPRIEGDFEALVDLDLASARHHAELDPGFYWVPDRQAVAAFLGRRLAELDGEILVAVAGGRVVGMVGVALERPPDPGSIVRAVPTVDLGISVLEEWRGRGVGQALMAAAERWARGPGARRMVLDMSAANDGALRFYGRLGYHQHGRLLRRELGVSDA
jgi:GNAT superfamily N-acetyltransferase